MFTWLLNKQILNRYNYSCLIFALSCTGCEKKDADVELSISVKNSDNVAISDAIVTVDAQNIGKTNANGVLTASRVLAKEKVIRLEIKKDSRDNYYASYVQNVHIKDADQQLINISAIMYTAPKSEALTADVTRFDDASTSDVNAAKEPQKEPANAKESPLPLAKDNVANPTEVKGSADAATSPLPNVTGLSDETSSDQRSPDLKMTPLEPAVNFGELVQSTPVEQLGSNMSKRGPNVPQISLPLDSLLTGGNSAENDLDLQEFTFNVHTYDREKILPQVTIYLANADTNILSAVCETDERGRCMIKKSLIPGEIKLVAKKTGFVTETQKVVLGENANYKFNLTKGHSIDIFTLKRGFNRSFPLSEVEVSINDQVIGKTDKSGYLSYAYAERDGNMVKVVLKSKQFLPEVYETSLLVSGPIKIERYFVDPAPSKIRLAMLDVHVANSDPNGETPSFGEMLNDTIKSSVAKNIFMQPLIREYPLSLLNRYLKKNKLTLNNIQKSGWSEIGLARDLDGIIKTSVSVDEKPEISITVEGVNGKILAAAHQAIPLLTDKVSIDSTVRNVIDQLLSNFPFEAAVLSKEGNIITVNAGNQSGHRLAKNDKVELIATQLDEYGQKQTPVKISGLSIDQISSKQATIKTTQKLAPRIVIGRGDLVIFHARPPASQEVELTIVSENNTDSEVLPQTSVYVNDKWLGASDENGHLMLDRDLVAKNANIKIIKQGYKTLQKSLHDISQAGMKVSLKKLDSYLRIESEPAGLVVKIEGQKVGTTPITKPIPVATGFEKIEIEASAGFKSYSRIYEFDEGTLDLTGNNKILLETDFLSQAQNLVQSGKIDDAISILNKVPKDHSDYLLSMHTKGELYLSKLDKPQDAAEAFAVVTSNDQVAKFVDKRFIGTFINEGTAWFLAAEKSPEKNVEVAAKKYLKSVEAMEKVEPYLRFVPKNMYAKAVHSVSYYKALSRQKLYMLTKEPELLDASISSWQEYLDSTIKTLPADQQNSPLAESGRVYYKQALIDRNKTKM